MAIQSAFDSLIITPVNYICDVLNGVYENTPLKKHVKSVVDFLVAC